MVEPPRNTRAWVRGKAISLIPEVVKASWTSLVVDQAGQDRLVRIPLPDPNQAGGEDFIRALHEGAQAFISLFDGGKE